MDVNVLPIIGLAGRVDWGVQTYKGPDNGGIAGTVTYDTTRNELDPANAVTEPYQPGVPNVKVHLYAVVRDDNGDPVREADGSLKRGPELNDAYTSETWEPGRGCTARRRSRDRRSPGFSISQNARSWVYLAGSPKGAGRPSWRTTRVSTSAMRPPVTCSRMP